MPTAAASSLGGFSASAGEAVGGGTATADPGEDGRGSDREGRTSVKKNTWLSFTHTHSLYSFTLPLSSAPEQCHSELAAVPHSLHSEPATFPHGWHSKPATVPHGWHSEPAAVPYDWHSTVNLSPFHTTGTANLSLFHTTRTEAAPPISLRPPVPDLGRDGAKSAPPPPSGAFGQIA